MGRHAKRPRRDVTKLSGKALSETLEPSLVLSAENTTAEEQWVTSNDLTETGLHFIPEVFQQTTLYLLTNVNKSSSVLFRADILFDSEAGLSTPKEQERDSGGLSVEDGSECESGNDSEEPVDPLPAREVNGFVLTRTVVRRLIPRNPQLDQSLDQTCHFYKEEDAAAASTDGSSTMRRFLVVYTAHVASKEDMPYYHPVVRSLAMLYDYDTSFIETTVSKPDPGAETTPETAGGGAAAIGTGTGTGVLSVHFIPYPDEPIPTRLERTLNNIIEVQIRLAQGARLTETLESANHNPTKDNVLPQHLVQNTYSRLKAKYSADLCGRWVEATEPKKHVFEDIAVAAFLIELWRNMYGCVPSDEQSQTRPNNSTERKHPSEPFPGFVDVACGNGVLVYLLIQEGYQGWGFDARRRKTWTIFPKSVQDRLKEEIYIPKPFADELSPPPPPPPSSPPTRPSDDDDKEKKKKQDPKNDLIPGVKTHTGTFPKHTFIISNHADELTIWTPIMATLLNPASPSPFLAIPCCSHSLSGARHRYPPPPSTHNQEQDNDDGPGPGHALEQPKSGSLRDLRKSKQDAADPNHHPSAAFLKSTYGSLTAKTVAVAEDVGYAVEKTILRIPSTRNMGVIGGRVRAGREWRALASSESGLSLSGSVGNASAGAGAGAGGGYDHKALEVVRKECAREGGVYVAAKTWIEGAKKLHFVQGRCKSSQHGG
ncbi:hypothetical protein P175DRAFT_0525647 [Aspergillus ochraceoroseus IBT 24754]|uniref:tRNA (uracil-O(2)-)-methyltransferase n=2 Tax=Aspergillus ochraceoroseus TaxID=138278 RepID=A0A2T5LRJ9_9EURO|nr:uncharacterized protein P175DRAFT_0525647 [Aspergillus ochraceoroseus IBT 24754]KKK22751.1 hypothetical protein AOCH_006216 [Aspergillus ochraceoroseus]PTU18891.1 hypothetical protein P175DRAFT_0525647 [Aspergillus ochraceoroseus IBT 24754]